MRTRKKFERKYPKVCGHCGKNFLAAYRKTSFCSVNCCVKKSYREHRSERIARVAENRARRMGVAAYREIILDANRKYSRIRYVERRTEILQKRKDEMAKLREEFFDAYGHTCSCCGETEKLFLTGDHVNNDGYKDRKHGKGGKEFLRYLKRRGWPKDITVSCFNCNCGRARTPDKICPHKKKLPAPTTAPA